MFRRPNTAVSVVAPLDTFRYRRFDLRLAPSVQQYEPNNRLLNRRSQAQTGMMPSDVNYPVISAHFPLGHLSEITGCYIVVTVGENEAKPTCHEW